MEKQLKVGMIAPDFCIPNQSGESACASDLVTARDLLLVFHRFLGCSLAQYDMAEISEARQHLKDIELAVVLQSPVSELQTSDFIRGCGYTVLADPEGVLYRTFGVTPAECKKTLIGGRTLDKIQLAREAGFQHGNDTGNPLQLPAVFWLEKKTSRIKKLVYCQDAGSLPNLCSFISDKEEHKERI